MRYHYIFSQIPRVIETFTTLPFPKFQEHRKLGTMSSSSNPTNLFPFYFSESNHKIPSKNYSHTMSIGTPEMSTNITSEKVATIDLHVQGFKEPHIVQNAIELGNKSPNKEFKIVFDVKVVEIDLADGHECDGYRRRDLI
ncbi:hypothetical protein MTR_3g025580 [Medicago truncatula]|uniref:Uncharacterized protein n=1 Tax=Medicago truncatula TaxID=3880 RepID=G7IZA1_MEDTR|nr:hypothetical protein MTR_3g025580 [Medicago truncatula]